MTQHKALLVNVGMGNASDLENSLFSPFQKTLMTGRWDKVVLLCSQQSAENARLLARRHADVPVQVETLPRDKDETDLDRCFSHFDRVIRRLIEQEGYRPENLAADFTRGTKVMSAALVMAAVARGIGHFRYIDGEQRDQATNMVIGGTEKLTELRAEAIYRAQRLAQARAFLKEGLFSAVPRLLEGDGGEEARWLIWAAHFWGAWDWFAYKKALDHYKNPGSRPKKSVPDWMNEFWPSEDQIGLLEELARREPPERKPPEQADATRRIAADLVQNTARRLREGHTEEVLVRLYRLVELVGQIRLFTHGIDSAKAKRSDRRVRDLVETLPSPPRLLPGDCYELGRDNAARLLAYLEDPFAKRLVDLNWLGLNVKARNRSILIHGFKARSAEAPAEKLQDALTKLKSLLEEESGSTASWIEAARFRFLRVS